MPTKRALPQRGRLPRGNTKSVEREVRAVLIRLNRNGLKALRQLALDGDRTLQSLGIEAFNDILRKYGARPVIENPLIG